MRNQEPRTDKSDWSVQTSYALNNAHLFAEDTNEGMPPIKDTSE